MPKENFEGFVKNTYGDVPRAREKVKIDEEYRKIEESVNGYAEKKVSAKELSEYLGNAVLVGLNKEHPSSRIYAYEQLIKSLSNTDADKKADIDLIVEEVLFDAAEERNPNKRIYLLGILYHYSSQERINNIEQKLSSGEELIKNARIRDEVDIITKIKGSVNRLREKIENYEDLEKIMHYIIDDFSGTENECEAARLIANYYEKESSATRPPSFKVFERYIDKAEDMGADDYGNGEPRYIYTLPEGLHPSQRKIDEAGRFGKDLEFQAANIDDRKVKFVPYDLKPDLRMLYYRRIRYYKDKQNYQRIEKLENALQERVWRDLYNLDSVKTEETFLSKEDMVVLKKTIRDFPRDDVLQKDLEQIIEKDLQQEA